MANGKIEAKIKSLAPILEAAAPKVEAMAQKFVDTYIVKYIPTTYGADTAAAAENAANEAILFAFGCAVGVLNKWATGTTTAATPATVSGATVETAAGAETLVPASPTVPA